MSAIIKENSRVRVRAGVNLENLQLSAQEGFLLSRIGADTKIQEIYQLSILDKASTATLLKSLIDQGVVEVIEESVSKTKPKNTEMPNREFGNFIFNLIDLQEEVDLSDEMKKDILFVFENLENLTYYDLLMVGVSAPESQIKKQFALLSRLYHPDSHFRKNLGSYAQKLNAIYSQLAQAHSTLADQNKRYSYRMQLIEEGILPADPDEDLADPHERKRRMAKAQKKQRISRNPLMGRVLKAKEFYDAGIADMDKEEWISAANNFKLAITYDPNNELYKLKSEQVKDFAAKAAAHRTYQRALILESYGQDGYFEMFVKSAQTYPQGAEFNVKVANLYCDQSDWREALPYAKRAAASDKDNIETKLLLSSILLKLKEKSEAIEQIQGILKRDPENEIAKMYLKEAKKWF